MVTLLTTNGCNMKIRKSKIQRSSPIGELPENKVRLTCGDDSPESIWVAEDKENNVMYLLNHAVCFFPYPSWGMELPLQDSIDVFKYRGETPDDTDITVCEEAYEYFKKFIKKDDEFDCEAYLEDQKRLQKEEKL